MRTNVEIQTSVHRLDFLGISRTKVIKREVVTKKISTISAHIFFKIGGVLC